MKITYDPRKRLKTLSERAVDFDDAAEVFDGQTYDFIDDRHDYGEIRVVTLGLFRGRMMVIVWTQRGDYRHVISMRKANDREKARYGRVLGSA
jgi:hypothetical protein